MGGRRTQGVIILIAVLEQKVAVGHSDEHIYKWSMIVLLTSHSFWFYELFNW